MKTLSIFFVATLLVVGAAALTGGESRSLRIDLEAISNGVVRFSLTNSGDEAVRVLTYGLPLEGMYSSMFEVRSAATGLVVPYSGAVARRVLPPPASSYVTILAHNSLSIDIDLQRHYAIEKEGRYEVMLSLADMEGDLRLASKPDGTLSITVHNVTGAYEENVQEKDLAGQFENCSNQEQSQTTAAITGAITNSKNAYNCMRLGTCNATVETWFGNVAPMTYQYDRDMFKTINGYFSADTPNYHCNPVGCGPSVYAYVYPTDKSMTIYLCGAFWSQANERVNTLVHEESHFNAVGGTQDYTYGKPNCLALAKGNPLQASHNADNVCYFADDA